MYFRILATFGLLVAYHCASHLDVSAEVLPANLRCEYLVNPLGVDVPQPRLSWELRAATDQQRSSSQSAYHVLVASNPATLATDCGDLWDTGRVNSDETIHIAYAGQQLRSRSRCYWKVRVWDENGVPSPWSEPAMWSIGLLHMSDWQAQWISDEESRMAPGAEAAALSKVNSGWKSAAAATPDTEKWVGVDLGKPERFDRVRLYPTRAYNTQEDMPASFFPYRLKIEAADAEDFSDSRTVVDRTQEDLPIPDLAAPPPEFRFEPVTARFVRVVGTRLAAGNELIAEMWLAELEVLSVDRNLALGKPVLALDSTETIGWSKDKLVDGVTRVIPRELARQPVTMLRKEFVVNRPIVRATAYATARGIYELRLNGQRVGDREFAPEWTGYHKRIQYQAYDVTSLLHEGNNAAGAILAAGWYAGQIGLTGRAIYGETPQFLAQFEVELDDGTIQRIVTDSSWRSTIDGPIVSADLFDGEIYDARLEMPGWDQPDFPDEHFRPVVAVSDLGSQSLVWQRNEPIRVTEDLHAERVTELQPGVFLFDLGQNMVGRCRLRLRGEAGRTATIRYGEMLHEDGSLYTANLTYARATDQYTFRQAGEAVYEPRFTCHGFRYVEVTGVAETPDKDALVGRVIHSAASPSGSFTCSSQLFNQLMRNIVWTQRGNMMSVLTDCPQRAERLGWTGDFQAFSQTAMFNMDMAALCSKVTLDLRDDQTPNGRFPDITPHPLKGLESVFFGAPGWGDTGVIFPWRAYQNYADKRLLEEHFEAARRWVDYVHQENPNLIWENSRGLDYNDWLNGDTLVMGRQGRQPRPATARTPVTHSHRSLEAAQQNESGAVGSMEGWPRTGGNVPKAVFATAFFAHSADLVSQMAAVLDREAETQTYRTLFEDIKAAFNQRFVDSDGRIPGDTQAGYALALQFHLLPEPLRAKAACWLVEELERYQGHPSTGIQTTHRMMLTLSDHGYSDVAYQVLNQRTFPSWGSMIDNGATTIWERWDGFVKGRGFYEPYMNSFNHVALGSVGEWMWRTIVGLNPDDAAPGYKHFTIRPLPGGGLTWAEGQYQSIRGLITVDWRIESGSTTLKVHIPVNTQATVYVPTNDRAAVRESGRPVDEAEGVTFVQSEENTAVYRCGSGIYEFMAPY